MIEQIKDNADRTTDFIRIICDGCGNSISDTGSTCASDDGTTPLHFCDNCGSPANQEFRICNVCGKPMVAGMTDLESFYAHEKCFKVAMDNAYGSGYWRESDDEGVHGGYYEGTDDNVNWNDTGIFYTEWC